MSYRRSIRGRIKRNIRSSGSDRIMIALALGAIGVLCLPTAGWSDCVDYGAGPHIVGGAGSGDYAWRVAVAGDYAYIADYQAGLRIIDVSDPTAAFGVGAKDTPG
ncbi:MAG: hypothetical protein KAY32_07855 [Candidatus Eisenbacteria sp.]|nr:hypothetical protein [Candidatus Eisenbacteria bacterium]